MPGTRILSLAAVAALSAAAPYGPGEKMAFSVRYLGLRVGVATIASLPPEGGVLPVQLEAKTVGIGSLYKLDERISSALDLATGLPTRSRLDADEKGRRHAEITTFDRAAALATVRRESSTKAGGPQVKTDLVPLPPGATDLLALVYRLRVLPLVPGEHQIFPVLAGNKLRDVEAVVEGREKLDTDAGTFDTLKIRVPTAFGGKFQEKHPTLVWLSDDARRIVVRLSTDFSIGQAVAELKSYTPPDRTLSPGEGGGSAALP
jgi:hypothetical protein